MRYIIGLTGLIGSGKSTVADFFANCGAGIIDTDKIAHAITLKNGIAIEPIIDEFGKEFISYEGHVDRAKLRSLVFEDSVALTKLEQILHPIILDKVIKEIDKLNAPYIILVVPLLFKAKSYLELINRSLFIDAHEHLIFERVMTRSKLSYPEIFKILNSQMPREKQLSLADDIIINNDNEMELNKQVEALDLKYQQLATS